MPADGILGFAMLFGPLGAKTYRWAAAKCKNCRLCVGVAPRGKEIEPCGSPSIEPYEDAVTKVVSGPQPKVVTQEAAVTATPNVAEKHSAALNASNVVDGHEGFEACVSEEQLRDTTQAVELSEEAIAVMSVVDEVGTKEASEEPVEFELWVETDLEASWCLEDECSAAARLREGEWRDACRTSSLRRRWEDFEALASLRKPTPAGSKVERCRRRPSTREAFKTLGLDIDADVEASKLASTFRQLSLKMHPDKAGSTEAFNALVDAYQVAQSFVAQRVTARTWQ